MKNYILEMTEQDRTNLVRLLNRVPVTGLEEAEHLVTLANRITRAPEAKSEGKPPGDE